MRIRRAKRSDIRPLAQLWFHSFPNSRSVAERVAQLEGRARGYGGLDTARLAEGEDGSLLGAYRGLRLTQHLHGAELPMLGLASVAVSVAARRRGLGRDLCRHALREAFDRGDAVSVLYPFRPSFYRSLGWGLCGELHTFRFRPESLLVGGGDGVRLADDRDEEAIAACYDRFAERSHGPIERSEDIWAVHRGTPDGYALVHDADGIRGYMLVRYGHGRSVGRHALIVRELVTDDDTAYEALLTWISRQRDLWRRVRYDACPDEHFAHRLKDPRFPGHTPVRDHWAPVSTVACGPMFRLVNVARAVAARRVWGTDAPLDFRLEVRDEEISENIGPFHVSFDGKRARVREARDEPVDAALTTDAATMAQLYAGEIDLDLAVRLGQAEVGGDAGRLAGLLRPKARFRLLDAF